MLLALAAPAAGASPPVARSLTVLAATPLQGCQGAPASIARAFSAWEVLAVEPGRILAGRFGPGGRVVAGRLLHSRQERAWPRLWLFAPEGLPGPWWVPAKALAAPEKAQPEGSAQVSLSALGWLPVGAAVLLPGPATLHAKRLARLARAAYPASVKARLAAGRIARGDDFWRVEMAWGLPQRSFMVNYLSDEQHYVYLRPQGPVLLRFQGGRLAQTPPEKDSPPPQVANPPSRR